MTHNTMLATALTALLIPSAPTAEAKPRRTRKARRLSAA